MSLRPYLSSEDSSESTTANSSQATISIWFSFLGGKNCLKALEVPFFLASLMKLFRNFFSLFIIFVKFLGVFTVWKDLIESSLEGFWNLEYFFTFFGFKREGEGNGVI